MQSRESFVVCLFVNGGGFVVIVIHRKYSDVMPGKALENIYAGHASRVLGLGGAEIPSRMLDDSRVRNTRLGIRTIHHWPLPDAITSKRTDGGRIVRL